MNGEYYQNPIFPEFNQPNNYSIPNNIINNIDDNINNIIKKNKNKKVTLYISKENKPLSGIIEKNSKEYIIIYNPEDGKYYLIPINNINYIIFDEKIN